MKKQLIIIILALGSVFTASYAIAVTPQITGPDMEIINNDIIVNLSIDNVTELETTIRSGIEKEIIFTIELLRVWRFWPDEFIVSKKITRVIKYDNLREIYRALSYDGISRIEKRFKDFNTMKDWIFNVTAVNLANIRELESGGYYVRVMVESKSLEQLPVIGLLMHLIPEVEMSLAKESETFIIRDNK